MRCGGGKSQVDAEDEVSLLTPESSYNIAVSSLDLPSSFWEIAPGSSRALVQPSSCPAGLGGSTGGRKSLSTRFALVGPRPNNHKESSCPQPGHSTRDPTSYPPQDLVRQPGPVSSLSPQSGLKILTFTQQVTWSWVWPFNNSPWESSALCKWLCEHPECVCLISF